MLTDTSVRKDEALTGKVTRYSFEPRILILHFSIGHFAIYLFLISNLEVVEKDTVLQYAILHFQVCAN